MNNFTLTRFLFLIVLIPFLQGCEMVGDIFEAGIWIGVTIVLIVILIIFWLFRKMRN